MGRFPSDVAVCIDPYRCFMRLFAELIANRHNHIMLTRHKRALRARIFLAKDSVGIVRQEGQVELGYRRQDGLELIKVS